MFVDCSGRHGEAAVSEERSDPSVNRLQHAASTVPEVPCPTACHGKARRGGGRVGAAGSPAQRSLGAAERGIGRGQLRSLQQRSELAAPKPRSSHVRAAN